MPPRSYVARFGLGIALAAIPATAFAHPGHGIAQGFSSGFVHPLQGLDHLIAMVAVGMIAARMGGRALWALPAAFLSMLALGGFLGMQGKVLPYAETSIVLSLAVFGLALLFDWRVPAIAAAVVAGLFAISHGYVHGIRDSCRLPVGRLRVWVHAGRRASDRRWNRLRTARAIAPKSLI